MSSFKLNNHFFIIKKEYVFEDNFSSEFCDDLIVVTCFIKKADALKFERFLLNENLNFGENFVMGTCDNQNNLKVDSVDWLKFEFAQNDWRVSAALK